MKLLLFSDVHRDLNACRRLIGRADEAGVDVAVGAGDLATMREGLDEVVDELRAMQVPTVLVPGNGESDAELAAACEGWEHGYVLHGSGVEIHGVPFWGLGGGVPRDPVRVLELRSRGAPGPGAALRLPRTGGPRDPLAAPGPRRHLEPGRAAGQRGGPRGRGAGPPAARRLRPHSRLLGPGIPSRPHPDHQCGPDGIVAEV